MNLADMLSYADIGQLTTIASHYQCQCKRNSKHELIQSILVTLNRREFIAQQVNTVSLQDLRFLNSVLFDSRSFYSVEDLAAVVRQTTFDLPTNEVHETPREAIARYKRSGWLFNGMTSSTKYLFQMPVDLKDRFRAELGHTLKRKVVKSGEPPVYREEQDLCAEDLMYMLKYVNQQEIELNQEFVMYKRYQQQLMDMFHVSEPLLTKGGWRFGYGRSFNAYPNRMALLYDYAFYHRYIEENGSRLELSGKGAELLESGTKESMVQIFRFWLKLYKSAIPNLASLVYWTGECAKEWVTAASLHDALGWLIKPFYYDTAESILNERIIAMMMHLGLIRIGESPESGMVLKMTAFGQKLASKSLNLGSGELEPLIDKS
ncbi:hypothetical protein [Paenibacillus sp. Y412MC10]|uniref:hypothetical protein n=1 Tax=Geobacillus sp. (strain Y412MC10) TaxID=481743 RepID=UPI0011A5EFF1|nr:hypothetical protein [Paenibacillus sp. Y412MC10]